MKRGHFLQLLAGSTAVVATAPHLLGIHPRDRMPTIYGMPAIYGDGIHDDAPGLQAAFDGKPYYNAMLGRRVMTPEPIYIHGRTFLIGSTVTLPKDGPVIEIQFCTLVPTKQLARSYFQYFISNHYPVAS